MIFSFDGTYNQLPKTILSNFGEFTSVQVFPCFVAIVRVRVYHVDFFVFFVLHHWWGSYTVDEPFLCVYKCDLL